MLNDLPRCIDYILDTFGNHFGRLGEVIVESGVDVVKEFAAVVLH